MELIKFFILCIIFFISVFIGKNLSKKYTYRLDELEEIQTLLNVLKTKIKFTYEPLPQIFEDISKNSSKNVSYIFSNANNLMNEDSASQSWEESLNIIEKENMTNLNKEDIKILRNLSKLLGQTDVEGQISQIEITQNFLQPQIKEAEDEKKKNEKLYSRLGTTIGLAIVIILI